MATSSGEEIPRNVEFLFSRNRLNVAVSYARCPAVLICSPRLLDIRAASTEQMRSSTRCAGSPRSLRALANDRDVARRLRSTWKREALVGAYAARRACDSGVYGVNDVGVWTRLR